MPTFAWPSERLHFIVAGGDSAFVTSIEGAEDDIDDAIKQVSVARLTPRDVCEELASRPLFLLGRQSRATQPDRGGNDDENSSVGADDTCEH